MPIFDTWKFSTPELGNGQMSRRQPKAYSTLPIRHWTIEWMKFGYYMASWQESEWGNVRFFLSHWSFQNFTISQRRWLKASSIDFVVDIGMMKQGCFMFELDCMILHSAGVDWFNKVLSSRRWWCILVGEDDARVMWTLVTLVNWLGVDNRDSKATIIYDSMSMTERCDSERLALMWVETTWNHFFRKTTGNVDQDLQVQLFSVLQYRNRTLYPG